ncbi:Uncharacterized protein PBTT_00009 [Plasmodiophora brassicae]
MPDDGVTTRLCVVCGTATAGCSRACYRCGTFACLTCAKSHWHWTSVRGPAPVQHFCPSCAPPTRSTGTDPDDDDTSRWASLLHRMEDRALEDLHHGSPAVSEALFTLLADAVDDDDGAGARATLVDLRNRAAADAERKAVADREEAVQGAIEVAVCAVVDDVLRQADAAFDDGRYDVAQGLYEFVLQRRATDARACERVTHAKVAVMHARDLVDDADLHDRLRATARIVKVQGDRALNNNQVDAARTLYEAALTMDPNDTDLHQALRLAKQHTRGPTPAL